MTCGDRLWLSVQILALVLGLLPTVQADPPSVAHGDWSQFRGPTGMGNAGETDLPSHWTLDDDLAWRTPLPGPGASSPITFGNSVYVTCYSGYLVPGAERGRPEQLRRHLLAVDRHSGNVLWERTLAAKLPEEESIRDHGFAASTPVADVDGVYVFFGKSGVIAFDHHGEQRWQADVGQMTNGWGTAASPILYRDLVIVNASVESESLVALDRRTGKVRWSAPEIRESWNTPLVVATPKGRDELLVARHGDVLAFDPAVGELKWSCRTDIQWYMVPTAVYADGVAYYLGGRSGITSLAVRVGGMGDVTDTQRIWTSKYGTNVTSPILHGGHLYWMSDQLGIAYCANVQNGTLEYQERMEQPDQVYASPVLAHGRIYYLTRGGDIYAIAAEPRYHLLGTTQLRDGSQFNASPAIVDHQLIVRSDKFLYCLGR